MDEAGGIITLQAGAYRLRKPLAASSYGVLWLADGPPHLGEVALKLVNRERMERAGAAVRGHWIDGANNEIGFLCGLAPWDQRHIVRLLDSGAHQGLPACALELQGADLGRHVAAERRSARCIPFERVLDWIGQANQALAIVHRYGYRYLDLKPGNLLLDARGRLRLADFGTIRPLSDLRPHPYTGTPRWQAPEQFFANMAGTYDTDARTDYFALGALFYWFVAGQPLQFCTQCAQPQASAANASLPMPKECLLAAEANRFGLLVEQQAPGSGHAALTLLRHLLAPQREHRPRHALEVSRALAAIRDESALPMRHAA